jgi:transcriptional regulator with XRE-family HTH domain
MATASALALHADLDEESWGERVARARARSKLSLKEAAARVSALVPTSYSTLMRLEALDVPPSDVKRRVVAFLALVAYGYDPAAFGLSEDDLPRRITPAQLDALTPTIGGYFNAATVVLAGAAA